MKQGAAVPPEQGPGGSALEEDGYIVVPTGLPRAILQAVVDDIWRHAAATPGDPATWYQPAVIRPRPGMVEMYHYQSMWEVRQHPAVYRIFRDLHGTGQLWVSIDRVALKPPVRTDQRRPLADDNHVVSHMAPSAADVAAARSRLADPGRRAGTAANPMYGFRQ